MSELELEIGSVLLVGDSVVTIVEIEDGEVIFKVDETGPQQQTDSIPQHSLGLELELVGNPTPR